MSFRSERAVSAVDACEAVQAELVPLNVVDDDMLAKAVERPDLVVIGTHGRSGLKRMLLGSVADTILCTIDSDILVVPPLRCYINVSSAG